MGLSYIQDIEEKITKLEVELTAEREKAEAYRALPEEHRLAMRMHDAYCLPADCYECKCTWEKEGGYGKEARWDEQEHAFYLGQARKAIALFGYKLCERILDSGLFRS